ncbi:MAG: peptide-methionine (S)-S-oxide reductase MsrA [Candidatus Baltobacteraceae bacterium]
MSSAVATFGAGCFWGVEAAFRQLPGVLEALSGYSGGQAEKPTYQQVCTGRTGHAEVVQITYDPDVLTYGTLLDLFWRMHDPTTLNRQGPDAGTQYRSAIFYHTPEQAQEAIESKNALETSGAFKKPIVTQIEAATAFYPAEEYHQRYNEKHGVSCHISV